MFDDRLDKARNALKKKREQKAKFINNSMDNLRITKSEQNPIITDLYDLYDDVQKRISFLTDLVEKYDVLLNGILGEIENSPIKIISKICKIFLHRNLNADTQKYDDVYTMCLEIFDSSKEAFDALRKYSPILPSQNEIEEYHKNFFTDFNQDLLDINKIPQIITNYKNENAITNQNKIYASLAVDALFFKPDVQVNVDGTTSGFLENPKLDKKQINSFRRNIETFSIFIQKNWKNIIRTGFVYQVNPFQMNNKSIALHVIPHTNGKANSKIIETLYQIKNILRRYRIQIVCFSFDGDNTFKILNRNFFQSYINRLIKYRIVPYGRILSLRISPDFLHIIKRLRYRLLTHKIHMNFSKNSTFIDINNIKQILKNIPSIVFDDTQITKMHDNLPLTLFSLNNFIELFEKKRYDSSAFWFPISLSITAYSKKDIGFLNRNFLFETALWFLTFYKEKLDKFKSRVENKEILLNERKYNDSIDVLPYTEDLLIEFCNTLFSVLTIINKYENVDIDRTMTGPLEHCFGRSRSRSKNMHTLMKFISVLQEMNQEILLKKCDDLEKIKGRSLGFGVIVEDKDDGELLFQSTPQQIALQFLDFIDIDNLYQNSEEDDTEYGENCEENSEEEDENTEEIWNEDAEDYECKDDYDTMNNNSEDCNYNSFDELFNFVEQLQIFADEKPPKHYTVNKITLGTHQTKTIRQRICFSISKNKTSFMNFLKSEMPNQKFTNSFFLRFNRKLSKYPKFLNIKIKNPKKKEIIEHINTHYTKFSKYYSDALKTDED